MRLSDVALQNMRRRKSRTLLLLITIIIGLASTVFLYTTTKAMEEDVANKLDQFGSNILILPDAGEALTFGGITVGTASQAKELDMSLIPLMKTIKNKETLATIAPKLLADDQVLGRRVLLLGVDFPQELRLKKWWRVEGLAKGQIPQADEILAGSEVASLLGLTPGQKVEIKGRQFTVRGLIQPTGSPENDQAIFMDLPTLQQLAHKPSSISLIEAAAFCYTCPIDEVTRQLREKLPGTKVAALRATLEARDQTVKKFSLFTFTMAAILFAACAAFIAASLVSSVRERTRDIGVLRAIGFRRRHIVELILLEAGFLGLVGGILGYAAGMGLATEFGPVLAKMAVKVPWQPALGLYTVGLSVLIGLLAGAYPAWRAARLDPVEALRFI